MGTTIKRNSIAVAQQRCQASGCAFCGASVEFDRDDLLAYMRGARFAVISTLGGDGAPQAALVGVATTDAHQVIFDTLTTSRKHANLRIDPRVAIVISGPGERTLQYQGIAFAASHIGPESAPLREVYYHAWPDGRDRLAWPGLTYWCINPSWARYTDYAQGPLIAEFVWPLSFD